MEGRVPCVCLLLFMLCSPLFHVAAQVGTPGFPISGTLPTIPANVAQQIVDTLRTGGFSIAGWVIKAVSNFIPVYTTLMIPTNAAIAAFANLNQSEVPSLLLYHVATGVLPFNVLSQFPVGQRIPTMLLGNQLLVSNNNPGNFTFNDGVRVVRPNLCGNTSATSVIQCHGIDRVLFPSLAVAPAGAPGPTPARAPFLAPSPLRQPSPSPASRTPPSIIIPGPAIAPGAPPTVVTIAPAGANETSHGLGSCTASVSVLVFLSVVALVPSIL